MKRDKKALEDALAKINKNFGKGSIQALGEKGDEFDLEIVSTGSVGLDLALGVGGMPMGRIVEIIGSESSGKTTLALHIISESQKKGGICAFIDAEHAFDKLYAGAVGVDTETLLISQPDYGEQALEIAENLASSGAVDVIVVDSVAALTPKKEIDGEMGDSSLGLQARMMSQALRKLVATVHKNGVLLIFINQWREKIGVMYGSPNVPTGGNALKFYASIRLEVSRSTTEDNSVKMKDEKGKETGDKIGNLTKVKVVKNKVAPPFRSCEFDILYGVGIWKELEMLDVAVECKVVDKAGSYYSYKETKLGQGKDAVCELLNSNPELMDEIRQAILKK